MIFRKEFSSGLQCSGNRGFVDNAAVLEAFTSVSKAHTDSAGVVLPENIAWMVLDWKLRIRRRPESGAVCSIRTWVTEWNKIFGLRCYDIIDEAGQKCAEALSRWVLVNLKTRKFFPMTSEIMDPYGTDKGVNSLEGASFMKNIARNSEFICSSDAEVTKDMIDANGHVHNTFYVTLAESVLPPGSKADSVDISYRKEIGRCERLILDYCRYQDDNLVLIRTVKDSSPNAIVLFGN